MFKIRGAASAIQMADRAQLQAGVWTASAGNMAQGVAWCAWRLGLDCTVVAPDTTPMTKLAAIERLGATIIMVPFVDWLEIFRTRHFDGQHGFFIHAFNDPAVMAGNGTIALEILDDLSNVDTVVTPYGGGGLSCGVAAAFRYLKPDTKCFAAALSGQAGTGKIVCVISGGNIDSETLVKILDGQLS